MAELTAPESLRPATSSTNGLVAAGLTIYLGMVLWNGNAAQLYELLKQEDGFLRWAVSIIVLWFIWRQSGRNKIIGGIMTMAIIATFILMVGEGQQLKKLTNSINNFFKGN